MIPMELDPRVPIGNFLRRAMIAGYKAGKYVVSSGYRAQVRTYWASHPQMRRSNIRMMVFGVVLDCAIAWLIVEALTHRQ